MKAMIYDGNALYQVDTELDSYEFLKETVDGYIEHVTLDSLDTHHIDLWCNEEGKLIGLEPTAILYYKGKAYDYLSGNIVFTGHDGEGGTISLTDEQIDIITNKFETDGCAVLSGVALQKLNFEVIY